MPKISIIVPVYNCEKYLERCLDSIINQTFRNWECILVDDGSTDRSGKILDEYAEKDDRFAVFHKSNKGVSSARNYGMLKCKGDWVTFVDSDDWVENGWLKEFDDIIKIADFDIIRFGYYLDTRLASHKVSCGKDKTVTLRWLMLKEYHNNKYYGYLWNTVFNMRCVQTLRFDTSLHFCEDQLFLNNAITNAKNTYLSSRCFYLRE